MDDNERFTHCRDVVTSNRQISMNLCTTLIPQSNRPTGNLQDNRNDWFEITDNVTYHNLLGTQSSVKSTNSFEKTANKTKQRWGFGANGEGQKKKIGGKYCAT